MRTYLKNPVTNLVANYFIDSSLPLNISYNWNYGSLLGIILLAQIITGVLLACRYTGNIEFAFNSLEYIMRDVDYGWILRYSHANGASIFFILVYLHIGRGLYYGSYSSPRHLLWIVGVLIYFLMMGTAFLGYCLPFGQMSLWGATVITNLVSAIPWIGTDAVIFIWGNFSVANATLTRFYSLHYLLPFILLALVALHLIFLHEHGSTNPIGINSNVDKIYFHPYYTFKDIVGFIFILLVFIFLIFYFPNLLGHADNYIPANPLVTPMSIVPEWYFLAPYAILRSIPSKLGGVIAMGGSIAILILLPYIYNSNIRSNMIRPILKYIFWFFVGNYLLLLLIGHSPVEVPFVLIGSICSSLYFLLLLVLASI
jgi:ubiquinol-cytochrome c reductase cytochrome b subunit